MQVPVKVIINVIITASIFLCILGGFIIVFIKLFEKTKKNFTLEKENINKEFETQLLKTQLEIQEQTFKTVSQEIHDNIGQVLIFVKLMINTIELTDTEAAGKKLQESKILVGKTIQDLRELSKTMNTDFINDVGLVASIERQLAFLKKSGLYKTRLHVSGDAHEMPPQNTLMLFRIVQELMNNIVKHAEAGSVEVEINNSHDILQLIISDDGRGFEPNPDSLRTSTPSFGGSGREDLNGLARGRATAAAKGGKSD